MRLPIQGACQRRKPFSDAASARSQDATDLAGRKELPSCRYVLRHVLSGPTTSARHAAHGQSSLVASFSRVTTPSTQRDMLRSAHMPILATPNEDTAVPPSSSRGWCCCRGDPVRAFGNQDRRRTITRSGRAAQQPGGNKRGADDRRRRASPARAAPVG